MAEQRFSIIRGTEGWHFVDSTGRISKPYSTAEHAETAALSRELARMCQHLACDHSDEPQRRWTLLRLAFARLGPERLAQFHLRWDQEKQIRELLCQSSCAGGSTAAESSIPTFFHKYVVLFDDVVNLDWQQAIHNLAIGCTTLVDTVAQLLTKGNPDRLINGYAAYQWAACVFGMGSGGVGQQLDNRLRRGSIESAELAPLSSARMACTFGSHAILVARLLTSYFIHDLTSPASMRQQLLQCISTGFARVHEAVDDEITACQEAVACVVRCARANQMVKGGISSRDAALIFMGFHAIIFPRTHEAFVALATPRNQPAISTVRSGTGTGSPRVIDYAACQISRGSVWEHAPISAAILPAQGQTRSPKGHRA